MTKLALRCIKGINYSPLIDLNQHAHVQTTHIKLEQLVGIIEKHLKDNKSYHQEPNTTVALRGFVVPETLFDSYKPELIEEQLNHNFMRRGTARLDETGFKFDMFDVVLNGDFNQYSADIYLGKRWVARIETNPEHKNKGMFEFYKYTIVTTQSSYFFDVDQKYELTVVFLRDTSLDFNVDNLEVLSYLSDPENKDPEAHIEALLLKPNTPLISGVLTYSDYKEFKALLPVSFEQY